jgi:hypothetical protein
MNTRRWGWLVGLVSVSSLLLLGIQGCEQEDANTQALPTVTKDGGTSGNTSSTLDAGSDSPSKDSAVPDAKPMCEATPIPESVPAGWKEVTDWSCNCRFYVPTKEDQLPEPIEWEPCQDPIPSHLSCQRMKHTWNPGGPGVPMFNRLALDEDTGKPLLQFSRVFVGGDPAVRYDMVAEVDGNVRQAIYQPKSDGNCVVSGDGLYQNNYLYSIRGNGSKPNEDGSFVYGLWAGKLGELSASLFVKDLPTIEWNVSSLGPLGMWDGEARLFSWANGSQEVLYGAKNSIHLPLRYSVTAKDSFFFQLGNETEVPAVLSWDREHGIRHLLHWQNDYSRGAGHFGTDGVDMVWSQGEDRDYSKSELFPSKSIMTAPFTTDPAQAQAKARRLRSEPGTLIARPLGKFAVGCGYAARAGYMNTDLKYAMVVVRLSDGYSWIFPGGSDVNNLSWDEVLGITCEDIFVNVGVKDLYGTISRIRLDSLGPGIPPD